MKKILFLASVLLFIISLSSVSALTEHLGTFKMNDCIKLAQSCSNCTYNNITTIVFPNGNTDILNVKMTKSGTDYNYTYCTTSQIGTYIVNGFGDINGVISVWAYDFEVTPSGFADTIGFYFIILIISGIIIAAGFFIKDAWITILGTFGLYFIGVYTLINGIVGIKDMVTTWALGLIILGIAGYISINSAMEVVQEHL